jgi:hypothetical protein
MLWDMAPRTAALILDLAQQGAKQQHQCKFYRNEEAPPQVGPPGCVLYLKKMEENEMFFTGQ